MNSNKDQAASSNLTVRIFEDMRWQIFIGEFAPGERLSGERELVQIYDMN
jgi:DNA-binding GntR family transcriptional regulator